MIIWIHVPLDRKNFKGEGQDRPDGQLRAIIERKTMMNLIQAFSVSVKHCKLSLSNCILRLVDHAVPQDLRSEPGIYYQDLYPLLSFLPQNIHGQRVSADSDVKIDPETFLPIWSETPPATHKESEKSLRKKKTFNPEKVLSDIESQIPLRPARNPPTERLSDLIPFLVIFKPIGSLFRRLVGKARSKDDDGVRGWSGRKKELPPIDSNVPLEGETFFSRGPGTSSDSDGFLFGVSSPVTLFLSSYFQMLQSQALLTPPMATAFVRSSICWSLSRRPNVDPEPSIVASEQCSYQHAGCPCQP